MEACEALQIWEPQHSAALRGRSWSHHVKWHHDHCRRAFPEFLIQEIPIAPEEFLCHVFSSSLPLAFAFSVYLSVCDGSFKNIITRRSLNPCKAKKKKKKFLHCDPEHINTAQQLRPNHSHYSWSLIMNTFHGLCRNPRS